MGPILSRPDTKSPATLAARFPSPVEWPAWPPDVATMALRPHRGPAHPADSADLAIPPAPDPQSFALSMPKWTPSTAIQPCPASVQYLQTPGASAGRRCRGGGAWD